MASPRPFLLLRSYILIAAGILFIGLVLDSVLLWVLPKQSQDHTQRYMQYFSLIETVLLEDGESPASVDSRFSIMQSKIQDALELPVQIFAEEDLQGQTEVLDALRSGAIVPFVDSQSHSTLLKLLGGTAKVLAIGPIENEPGSLRWVENLIIVSYYILVALLLLLWIRPFYRDLSALRIAASQFGREDFSSRVEVSENSSILPVAQSFNRMAERIQYLITAHRDLSNAVAHELRTPLARFKFSLEMIGKSKDAEKSAQYLAKMKGDVQELEALIDEMLSYAKLSVENLQLHRSDIPIRAWLIKQLADYNDVTPQVFFDDKGDAAERKVLCNSELMARAMHNILRNCLRYATSEVRVSYVIDEKTVAIKICDDGPGIPMQYHQSIFEPFARLDSSRDKNSGGYGLGLAIARRILERHDGDIRVLNPQTKGVCFVLSWPYN